MQCEEARERWHRRFDEGAVDAELDRHMEACDSCRQYAAQMGEVTTALERLRSETDHVVSHARADGPVAAFRDASNRFPRWANWLTRVAAVVAFALTATLVFRPPTQRSGMVPTAPPTPTAQLGMTLKGESAQRFLAITKPTAQSNVQVFWVYPKLEASGAPARSS